MTVAALSPSYVAARNAAGLIARHPGLIIVSGRDRASYLQGLLTNDVVALTTGQGCYTAYLTAQGRMISDLRVYELGDAMLLVLPRATKDIVLAKLDQFIFSEDVQLGDLSETFASLEVVGPDAARLLTNIFGADAADLDAWALHGNRRLVLDEQPVIVVRSSDMGEPGFELVAALAKVGDLGNALRALGAVDVDDATAEALRVEGGVPLFGRDMDEETIPLEAGIEDRAISFTKGCYVGQEVIIRVLHRGHGRVARRLVGLTLEPQHDVPTAGTKLHADDSVVGEITSSVWSPALGRPIALGYVKRDRAQPGVVLQLSAGVTGVVVPVPFVSRPS
ncbi:MAG: glycine cleavage T C-terminal barrel domain-containing protein [Vicinamibacterales bacterium]